MADDEKNLAYKGMDELSDLTAAAIATSDTVPVYDASTGIVKTFPAMDIMNIKSIDNLDTLSGAAIASGDFIPVWDASASTFVKVDATYFGAA